MITFAILKDLALLITTCIGSYVAITGLNTWKRSLKGAIEYDLTRRLLRSTYKLRDAIKGVRNPMMWDHEGPRPTPEEAAKMKWEEQRHFNLAGAYQARWDKVSEVRNELQTDLLEAEVLWGKKIYELYSKLFTLQSELFINVKNYIEVTNSKTPPDSKEALMKIMRDKRNVLYELDSLGMEPDDFHKDMITAIVTVENYLKPHLKK